MKMKAMFNLQNKDKKHLFYIIRCFETNISLQKFDLQKNKASRPQQINKETKEKILSESNIVNFKIIEKRIKTRNIKITIPKVYRAKFVQLTIQL